MEEQDSSPLRLSDEQIAEVKRRLADPNPRFLTLDEVREHFARRRALLGSPLRPLSSS
jgi:hypothetical protein